MSRFLAWTVLPLWLMVAVPALGDAQSPQETDVVEQTTEADPQPFNLPSYEELDSPLPGAGVTSQVVTALGTVLGLMAAMVFVYKRFAQPRSRVVNHDATIKILSRTYLGPKESLCLVQVGSDVLLLGQTAAGITQLHTLSEHAVAESSSRSTDETTISPAAAAKRGTLSEFAREHEAVLATLDGRLRRLNAFCGTPTPGADPRETK